MRLTMRKMAAAMGTWRDTAAAKTHQNAEITENNAHG